MIIGLTGLMGSGKSTLVNVLKKQNYKLITLSDMVREECRKQKKEEKRENLMEIGYFLRSKFGIGILGKRALNKINEQNYKNCIVDGIRNPAEVLELRKHPDFILIANTAPEDMIIERILTRKRKDDTLNKESILKKNILICTLIYV